MRVRVGRNVQALDKAVPSREPYAQRPVLAVQLSLKMPNMAAEIRVDTASRSCAAMRALPASSSGTAGYSRVTSVVFLAAFAGVTSGSAASAVVVRFCAAVLAVFTWIAALAVHLYHRTANDSSL